MTWKPGNLANEAAKVRNEVVPYMRGVALDIGAGPFKVWPHFISVDSGMEFGRDRVDVVVDTAERLPLFASGSVDVCFSSHLLEHIPYENVPAALREWFRVTKQFGHVILYLPSDQAYPLVGKPGSNCDHKWNCNYENVVAALEQVECSWDMVDFQHRTDVDEYSLYVVLRKL